VKRFINKARKGFTLIELMIVVAIIGILAAIAIPNFIRYQLKSKTAETKTVMGGIKTSNEAFRAEYDNYAAPISSDPGAVATTKTAWIVVDCGALGCSRNAPASCTSFDCIGYKPSGDVYYTYATNWQSASAGVTAEMTVSSAADLDGNAAYGSFGFCTNNKAVAGNGASSCFGIAFPAAGPGPACALAAGAPTPAGEVLDCSPGVF
jgi:type IV pilus assembly protein PilA